MVQCPDCEAKDRITIAGKVFCANCGTPWVGSDSNSPAQAAAASQKTQNTIDAKNTAPKNPDAILPSIPHFDPKKPAVNTIPADNGTANDAKQNPQSQASGPADTEEKLPDVGTKVIPTAPKPISSTDAHKPKAVSPILPSSPLDIRPSAAPEPEPPASVPVPASAPASGSQIVKKESDNVLTKSEVSRSGAISKFHAASSAQISSQQPASAPSADSSTQTPQTPPTPQPFSMPIPSSPVSVSPPSPAPAVTTPPAPMPQSGASLSIPVTTPSSTTAANTGEPINDIEIASLDKKEPSVLSDEQFKSLAELDKKPAPSAANSQVSVNPVAQASPPLPVQPTPVTISTAPLAAPQTVSPMPAPPAPPVAPVSTPVSQPSAPSPAPLPIQPVINPLTPVPAPTPTPLPAAAQVPTQTNQRLGDIVPSAASAAAAQPKPQIVPAVPTMSGAGTIDGIGMSKDQALKLALDQPAAQTTTTKAGTNYRPLKIAVAVVLLLIVGGYLWQVNYPSIAFKVAAARAGVSANPPRYMPSGWSIGKQLTANNGQMTYTIKDANKNTAVKVTQQRSDWDSSALLENYVLNQTNEYTVVQNQGLSIYVYGDNKASWVNHGNWYQLDGGDSGLNQQQLIQIATSL